MGLEGPRLGHLFLLGGIGIMLSLTLDTWCRSA